MLTVFPPAKLRNNAGVSSTTGLTFMWDLSEANGFDVNTEILS